MKKFLKKTSLCLLVALMLLAALPSCAQKSSVQEALPFEEVYESSFPSLYEKAYKTATKIKLPDNVYATIIDGTGAVFAYVNQEKYCFYNADVGDVVLKIDESKIASQADISLVENYVKVVLTDPETEKKTTVIYNENGNRLCSASGSLQLSLCADGFCLGDKLYVTENGEVKKEYTLPSFVDPYANYRFLEDKIISITGRKIVYYDENFEIAAHYEIPGHSQYYNLYLLDNGNLFAQYSILCDPASGKYDYLDGYAKYKLYHELFDPTTKKTKELKLDGIYVSNVLNKERDEALPLAFEDIFTDNVKNVLSYYNIVEGLIDRSVTRNALLKNDGRLGASLEYVEDQKSLILPLSDGYYAATTKIGMTVLNTKGEPVRKLPTIEKATDFGYEVGSRIYDKNFSLVLDFTSDSNYTILNSSDTTAVFYKQSVGKTIKYYRYDKNGESEIIAPEGRQLASSSPLQTYHLQNGYYSTEHYPSSPSSTSSLDALYSYYGLNGDLLFTLATSTLPGIVVRGENAMVMKYTDAETNETVYVRVTKD